MKGILNNYCFWNKLEIGKAKYLNSTNSPTTIDSLFFLPGLFTQLIIELTSVNQTCSIEYSIISSPFYHCLFQNLTPAQWFVLTYYAINNNDQTRSGDDDDWKVNVIFDSRLDGHVLLNRISTE